MNILVSSGVVLALVGSATIQVNGNTIERAGPS